jgi:hypothetical protein
MLFIKESMLLLDSRGGRVRVVRRGLAAMMIEIVPDSSREGGSGHSEGGEVRNTINSCYKVQGQEDRNLPLEYFECNEPHWNDHQQHSR